MDLFTRQVPRPSATSAILISAGVQGFRTLSASFGGSLLSQEHTPVEAAPAEPGPLSESHARASAGSWARNRDQLSTRAALAAKSGFQSRPDGRLAEPHAGLLGGPVGLPALQSRQAATQLVQLDAPPRERGTTWSMRDPLPARLGAAILAGVVVALGDVPPAEGDGRGGQAVVAGQADDLGHPQPTARRADAGLAGRGSSSAHSAQP